MTKMSNILWEGHALSTDPTFPRAYEALILNSLHYKFLATPLLRCTSEHLKYASKCAISRLKNQKFSPDPSPGGEGDTPSPHPTSLGTFGASPLGAFGTSAPSKLKSCLRHWSQLIDL